MIIEKERKEKRQICWENVQLHFFSISKENLKFLLINKDQSGKKNCFMTFIMCKTLSISFYPYYYLYLSVYLFIHVSTYIYILIYLYIYLYFYLLISISLCLLKIEII